MLITQDRHEALHFDLKITHVTRYTPDDVVEIVARALLEAAGLFEEESAALYNPGLGQLDFRRH